MVISEIEFRYFPTLQEPSSIYPDLKNSYFVLNLQTSDNFITGIVTYDFTNKCICIAFYNENNDLIQPRIKIVENFNLLYLQGYYLYWYPSLNKFEFGSID